MRRPGSRSVRRMTDRRDRTARRTGRCAVPPTRPAGPRTAGRGRVRCGGPPGAGPVRRSRAFARPDSGDRGAVAPPGVRGVPRGRRVGRVRGCSRRRGDRRAATNRPRACVHGAPSEVSCRGHPFTGPRRRRADARVPVPATRDGRSAPAPSPRTRRPGPRPHAGRTRRAAARPRPRAGGARRLFPCSRLPRTRRHGPARTGPFRRRGAPTDPPHPDVHAARPRLATPAPDRRAASPRARPEAPEAPRGADASASAPLGHVGVGRRPFSAPGAR